MSRTTYTIALVSEREGVTLARGLPSMTLETAQRHAATVRASGVHCVAVNVAESSNAPQWAETFKRVPRNG
jgi:nicotinamidase-related amidase